MTNALNTFTLGPWKAISHPQLYDITIQADGYEKIAVITDRHSEYAANARLIAAAPELLEALQFVLDEAIHCDSQSGMVHPFIEKARAAISRATQS